MTHSNHGMVIATYFTLYLDTHAHKVRWVRIEAPMPDSAKTYGNTLSIEEVDPSDGGTYLCIGHPTASIVYAQVKIIIEGK